MFMKYKKSYYIIIKILTKSENQNVISKVIT